jgi:hypothetical protein
MALTITTVSNSKVVGIEKTEVTLEVTFDNSYADGGETIATNGYGITTIDECVWNDGLLATGIYEVKLIGTRASGGITAATDTKLVVYTSGAQVAGATDLSTLVGTLRISGR